MNYYLFVDESGDHGLKNIDQNFPVFALCGILISEEEYQKLIATFRSIKIRFWNTHNVIFHSRDIRKCDKEFQILLDIDVKRRFMNSINTALASSNFTIIASIINKQAFLKKYGKLKDDVYEVSLSFILERSVFFLDSLSETVNKVNLIIEQRGKKEDKKLKNHFDRLFQIGTYYVNAGRIKNYNFQMEIKPKQFNVAGLQLSDLIAYPIARYAIDKTRANPAFDRIKEKIYSRGKQLYGLKIFP